MSFLESLFPPRIERLLENRDVQGLIEALQFKRGRPSKRAIHYRRDAAKALGRVALPEVVEPLVEALGDDPKVKRAARTSLIKLTGKEDLGGSQERWRKWWTMNQPDSVWLSDLLRQHRTTAREKYWSTRKEITREEYNPDPPPEVEDYLHRSFTGDIYPHEDREQMADDCHRWMESVEEERQRRVDDARQRLERRWRKEDHWLESFRKKP
jgi:hypothetical protein